MSSSFAFLPRTVSKAKKSSHHVSSAPKRTSPTLQVAASNHPTSSHVQQKSVPETRPGKSKYSNEDYAYLVCLALSDFALWSDPDLRRAIEWSSNPGPSTGQETAGFIPLSHLLNRSNILAPLKLGEFQTAIAKALRSCAAGVIDVQLLVSDPSSSTWLGGHEDSVDIGAYEIRRKARDAPIPPSSKSDWEKRTVYVENLPVLFRTIPAIARFLTILLSEESPSDAPQTRVQNVAFPHHHQDKPGDKPSCKGFALITLASLDDVDILLNRWPWDRNTDCISSKSNVVDSQQGCAEVHEALKFGFRTASRMRWDQLREEYIAYRGRLVEEINTYEDEERQVSATFECIRQEAKPPPSPSMQPNAENVSTPKLDYTSPFPANSLVFVRNIRPETNKTTLRKLFATAFEASLESGEFQSDGLDYVDFNKGMDSCHLRLATPNHAHVLVNHFTHNPISQSKGLDDVGTPASSPSERIVMEVVLGKREELYWDKVPEKVRRQAVQKAIILTQAPSMVNADDSGTTSTYGMGNNEADKRKRKRRKH